MGINSLDVNIAAINALAAIQGRPFAGAVQAERLCRKPEEDIALSRDASYFHVDRPAETTSYVRPPQFGNCGQEGACS